MIISGTYKVLQVIVELYEFESLECVLKDNSPHIPNAILIADLEDDEVVNVLNQSDDTLVKQAKMKKCTQIEFSW